MRIRLRFMAHSLKTFIHSGKGFLKAILNSGHRIIRRSRKRHRRREMDLERMDSLLYVGVEALEE